MKHLFRKYFEIAVFASGLLLLAMMNPETVSGPTLCLFDQLGITFCPGEGLGHAIAYTFQGDFFNAIQANMLGPLAIVILGGRIIQLVRNNIKTND